MGTNYVYCPPDCPEHPGEQLKTTTLYVKSPRFSEREGIPLMNYCPQSGKYLSYGKKLVSKEEAALDFINANSKTNFKLEEIDVQTHEEYMKTLK